MKVVEKAILEFQDKLFFKPIRCVFDNVLLLLYTSRALLINESKYPKQIANFKLIIDKSSRVYFRKNNKCFSVSFPFSVDISNNTIDKIYSRKGLQVTSKSISEALAFYNEYKLGKSSSLINLFQLEESKFNDGLFLLEELLQTEPCYIRYDCDPANENGKIHPKHHFDINFSQYGTYKLGLKNGVDMEFIQDMLDTNTDCKFIL